MRNSVPIASDPLGDIQSSDVGRAPWLDKIKVWWAEFQAAHFNSDSSSSQASSGGGGGGGASSIVSSPGLPCCIASLRARLLLCCIIDLFGHLYALASANRLRLVSSTLYMTGSVFLWLGAISIFVGLTGMAAILMRKLTFVRFYFYWSIFSCLYNFILSAIDLTSIDSECDYIWENFDHSSYGDKNKPLFLSQCASYAFVFFSVVMVAMALGRLYFIWLLRAFALSLDPSHSGRFQNYGYSHLPTGGGASYSSVGHANDDYDSDR